MQDTNYLKELAFKEDEFVSKVKRDITIKFNDGRSGSAVLTTITDDTSDAVTVVTVKIQYKDFECVGVSKTGNDFEALRQARQCFEERGGLIYCYGSSLDVYPVPGLNPSAAAYKLILGKPVSILDRVSIYDSGTDVIPASVEDQEAYFKSWLNSV